MAWASQKSRRPVKYTPTADSLNAIESLDILVLFCSAMKSSLSGELRAWRLVVNKNIYQSLTTQGNSVDHPVPGDVNFIPFMFDTKLKTMGWLRGSCNPAENGTKPNSLLTNAAVLMWTTRRVHINLSSCGKKSSDCHLG